MTFIKLQGEALAEIEPVTSGPAPDFELKDINGKPVKASSLTKPLIISVFPDINTSVCSLQTKQFNKAAASHQELDFLSISTNTPEEQKNWCAAEDVDMTILSDTGAFGEAYGLLLKSGALEGRLARSVFVVKAGEIVYAEVLEEITDEPDYEAALEAALA
ncbi:thiol peroxidase [Lactococcus termiticola]|uniref:Thiol peroxidase n=1 Tax=Lactococcus termiticola TaxID=2169526 RepID=A0A2R5HDE3_9LACT|nr:redoxin family protein [Lactococcus termiticola]GBG96097.1 thiol peroxidase [Lactococcus termiticola]